MSLSNRDRIDKALNLLREALAPFVEREMRQIYKAGALDQAQTLLRSSRLSTGKPIAEWDANALLQLMWDGWNDVFRNVLGRAERSLVREILDARHAWAHQQAFTSDETYRILDSVARLLTAISAPAGDVEASKMEVLRARYDEHIKKEKKKSANSAVESAVTGNLKPWREVISPHPDVAGGRYLQAEFAADLWQVHLGEGADAYRIPGEFFRRTYLTESLHRLLVSSAQRLSGKGGDPVVQLQTNFGGGKTHSMLALYHLFSGVDTKDLVGIEPVLKAAAVNKAPKANRAVLVGNKISPGNPATKSDGTVVRTLWGELAWQLGAAAGGAKEARKAFDRIAEDDKKATNPGDRLRELFNQYAPCVILIDEWVAYARQLHEKNELLPAGSFETQFSFAQALTESAKAADRCLLVVSLPASDTSGSPHTQADDAEVGGERGRAALARLRNVIGRVESSWRPASAEEGFEIVRRRLFGPLREQDQFVARDTVARSFHELYLGQHQEFPAEARESDYEKRLQAAYPIHPEVFDRLYTDWSTLLKFQRTRGVLRLMAAVIHSLWEKGDRNPLIMPGHIPIDDPRVQFELTRYLSDNWVPVIEKDVDGASSTPLRIDAEVPNLGKYHATRRVARTIYLGSAPTVGAAHQGIEDRRIKLGCVMPGEAPAVFGDALRRLSSQATYLYPDGTRYWYATQPTVAKVAEDYAERLLREKDKVVMEIERRLRSLLKYAGDFQKVHPLPQSGHDIPDEGSARLVVLGTDYPHTRGKDSPARTFALSLLESRGSGPRIFRNALTFLALDQQQLQNLDEAVRKYLAWCMILDEQERHNLSAHQVKQAEGQRKSADATVEARIPEAFVWLLVPTQAAASDPISWEEHRLSGSDPLAVRASRKLLNDEALITRFAGTALRLHLDRLQFLWRGNHVSIKQLEEDFARYLYMPRLRDSQVLRAAVADGVGLLSWSRESFAYADDFDEKEGRYLGLRGGRVLSLNDANGLLVKPEVAVHQLDAEDRPAPASPATPGAASKVTTSPPIETAASAKAPRSFHARIEINTMRIGRDAQAIAEEIVAHLSAANGADVTVSLEIEAYLPEGASPELVRTVTENCRTLKFSSHGFE